jgi:AraC-like DNA-binding protein
MLWGAEVAVERVATPHVHADHELVIGLGDGGAQWVRRQEYRSRRGQAWFLPAGVAHHVTGSPTAPMRLFYVCFPPGWFAAHGQPELETLITQWTTTEAFCPPLRHEARQHLIGLASGLCRELRTAGPLAAPLAHALLVQMLIVLAREAAAPQPPAPRAPQAERLDALCDELLANPAQPVRLDALARRVAMGRSAFTLAFRRHTGQSLGQFVLAARLAEAKRRLALTDEPVADIAAACGFRNLGHFHALFRRGVGQTPLRYRRAAERLGLYHALGAPEGGPP